MADLFIKVLAITLGAVLLGVPLMVWVCSRIEIQPPDLDVPEWVTSNAKARAARLCGPDCGVPDELHIEPEPDWIGDMPIIHGESDREVPGGWCGMTAHYCLCGHPPYETCPEPGSKWWSAEITPGEDGGPPSGHIAASPTCGEPSLRGTSRGR